MPIRGIFLMTSDFLATGASLSGKDLGTIEQEYLYPLLKEAAQAQYVTTKPISGINCMTIALSALSKPGDTIYTVPITVGGHVSTLHVAEGLGLTVKHIPFLNPYDINYEELETCLIKDNPAIVYIDQSTFLFPIDPYPIRQIINKNNLRSYIHYDSSHINGFILTHVMDNPLERGAHCFGGSTHKTLPGPHKGFLATNNQELYIKIQNKSDHFVSHSHMARSISLAITLLEN